MRFLFAFSFALLASAQQTPDLLLHQEFSSDVAGWRTMGPGGSLQVTHDASQSHAGHAALEFSYEIKRGQIAAAVRPAPREMAHMQHLRFWVKSDHDGPAAVLLSETKPGGGNYTAWFWSPANTWQQVDLMASDFVLSDGPQDPKDADGKLDVDQLQGVGILDLGSFFPNAPGNSGPHTMLIADFEVLGGATAPSAPMQIDRFDRGFLQWITTGAVDMKLDTADNPLHEPALMASYEQTDMPLPVILRRIGNVNLAKASRLEFDVASDLDTTLAVALELNRPGSQQGPRFNLPIYPPGKHEVFHVSIALADFQGQGTLDPSQLKTLMLTDPSGAGDGVGTHNRIWIGNVTFKP